MQSQLIDHNRVRYTRYPVKVHAPLVRVLLYALNDALYQVNMDEVTMYQNAGYSDKFKRIISSTSEDIVGIFDTGTSFILGPTAAVKAFAVGATDYNGIYVLDSCDASEIPSLSFKIQGKVYVISGSDLVVTMVRSIYS